MLPDNIKIRIVERVPEQIVVGIRQRRQAFPLGGGRNRTTGHDAPLENAGFR
jgi:hypothetical protein